MAKRKQLWHPDEAKEKIQASQLINRLELNALSEKEIMTSGQIRSAEILLKKAIPDLKQHDHTGEMDVTISFKTVYENVD